jgi:hypothetical protein
MAILHLLGLCGSTLLGRTAASIPKLQKVLKVLADRIKESVM